MPLVLILLAAGAEDPVFAARTFAGKEMRGPLAALSPDGAAEFGKGVRKKVEAGELMWLRIEGGKLPPLPSEEQLILGSGDRIPVRDLRLEDDKLSFRHPDLGGEASIQLPAVAMIWRMAPDRSASPETVRRRLVSGKRASDLVVLRNGDTLSGTVASIGAKVEVEKDGKKNSAPWAQVAAVAFSTDLASKPVAKGAAWRLAVLPSDTSAGGRFTITSPTVGGGTFRAKTSFGAAMKLPLERVASLEAVGEKAVALSALNPTKYEYFPYLDEESRWSADATEAGADLRVAGTTWDRGVSLRARSRIEYAVGGLGRFEAIIGLDSREGRRGRAKVRLSLDGKIVEEHDVVWGGKPARVVLTLAGAKALAIEVAPAEAGPVRAVVNVVDAWLVRGTP